MPPDHLRHFVRWYDDALPRELCEGLIGGFEQMQAAQARNGRGVRAGLEASAWTELNLTPLADTAMKGFFLSRVDQYLERYNAEIGIGLPIPPTQLTAELVIKRYTAGTDDCFQPHFDSMYDKSDRYLVFLWYLNDVAEGGETRFCDFDLNVAARAGRLLMFPPYWMFQHAGLPPRSNNMYILSTYLLFDRSPLIGDPAGYVRR
ncbi:MAG: 2OG-Fe(II) oxygenase [Rhodanobacteraceae bacterium]